VLKGDQADGIPNVLSADNVFVDCIRQTALRQSAIDQLTKDPMSMGLEVYRNYQRNYKLINLSQAPAQYKQEIINNFERQQKSADKTKVMNYFMEKRCRNLLEDLGDFI
jgi:hypothetical protein